MIKGAGGGVSDESAIERPWSSFLKQYRPAKRPSTFLPRQFQGLTDSDCSSAGVSEHPPPLPDCKPKWQGAASCLPSIMPEKKQYGNKKN